MREPGSGDAVLGSSSYDEAFGKNRRVETGVG